MIGDKTLLVNVMLHSYEYRFATCQMIDGEQIDFNKKKAPQPRSKSALFLLSGYRRGLDAARGRCPSWLHI
jgi:hypothetical protein